MINAIYYMDIAISNIEGWGIYDNVQLIRQIVTRRSDLLGYPPFTFSILTSFGIP